MGRVAADPVVAEGGDAPGGWPAFAYVRLHGTPAVYHSAYDRAALAALAGNLREQVADELWCVFDNTARGAATPNALELRGLLAAS